MQVFGRMIFAPIERHFSSKTMVVGVFALLAISLPLLLLGNTPALIILFVALFGMAIGTHTLTRPLIVADTYGTVFYGRISSAMVIFLTLAQASAPFLAGLVFDGFGTYDLILILATAVSLVAVLLIALLPRRAEGSLVSVPQANVQ